jgi:hypothetical protein
MSKDDRERADTRFNRTARTADGARNDIKTGKADRDAAAKAVIDNMARLKALRLAREAAEPARSTSSVKKTRAKPGKKSAEKAPALADWLADQQNGGRRT